jgi:hypothetical protein
MKKMLMVICTAALLAGCGTLKVRQVLNNPARYQGRTVRLDGEVTRSTGLVIAGVYEIDDGTGKINILSNRPIPPKGARVSVKGRMQSGINILGRSIGTVVQEQRVRVHN